MSTGSSDVTGVDHPLSWRSMLEATPVPNAAATVEDDGGGEVRVTVRTRRPAWLVPPLSWVARPRARRTFQLDRLGSLVWRLCDGRRTVEEVIDAFAQRFGLTFHEARVSVAAYLRLLVRRGALAVAKGTGTFSAKHLPGRSGEMYLSP